MFPLSVRARLTLWYTGVVLAILLVTSAASYLLLRWHLLHDLDASLVTMARVMSDVGRPDEASPLSPELEPLVRDLLGPEFADALLQLLDPQGRLRSRAPRSALPKTTSSSGTSRKGANRAAQSSSARRKAGCVR